MKLVRPVRSLLVRHRTSRSAISTIMANLTMLVIVVVLSSMLFVWAVSSFGAYQGGAGYWFSSRSIANQERPVIENVFFVNSGGICPCAKLYIRNVGTIPFTIGSVYVNSSYNPVNYPAINVSGVQAISVAVTLSGSAWTHGDVQTITIGTLRGTTIVAKWVS